MSSPAPLSSSWRRLPVPEFDKAIAKRDRILARHHHGNGPEPRMGVDDADGARLVLYHDIGQADRREPRRVVDLGLRFEPAPVSVGLFAEVGKGNGYALHEITGVFRVETAPVFHTIVPDADRQTAVRRPQKPELRHDTPLRSSCAHLGVFEGRRKRTAYHVDESYGMTKALLSLAALAAALFCMALVLGAV